VCRAARPPRQAVAPVQHRRPPPYKTTYFLRVIFTPPRPTRKAAVVSAPHHPATTGKHSKVAKAAAAHPDKRLYSTSPLVPGPARATVNHSRFQKTPAPGTRRRDPAQHAAPLQKTDIFREKSLAALPRNGPAEPARHARNTGTVMPASRSTGAAPIAARASAARGPDGGGGKHDGRAEILDHGNGSMIRKCGT